MFEGLYSHTEEEFMNEWQVMRDKKWLQNDTMIILRLDFKKMCLLAVNNAEKVYL